MKIPQVRDCGHSDAFSQLEANVRRVAEQSTNLDAQSARQLKISATSRTPWQQEDLEQNTTDIPYVMQRQVLAIQKAQRTVDVPVGKDAEKRPQEQHEDCMTKYKEIQMDKKLRSA